MPQNLNKTQKHILKMALEITDGNFEELVLKSSQPVLVDFWAVWCGPCRMLGPVIEEIAKEYEGKVVVGKVDVDNNQDFAGKYGIRNIPTVLVFKDGEVVGRQVGVAVVGLEVPHVHVHLIPISEMKEMTFQHKVKLTDEEFKELSEKVRKAL